MLLWRSEAGDSYCGSVLYDTVTARPCGSPILLRRVLSLVFGLAAIGAFATTSISGSPRTRRTIRALATLLIVLAAVGVLITANRLLQPTHGEYCGSIVNRHRTYEPAIETRCNDLLAPYRNSAIAVGVIALVALLGGIALWRRSAHD